MCTTTPSSLQTALVFCHSELFFKFSFEIVVRQSKTSFVTFMVPKGCPNANVYILNSSCDLHFEFWVN